MRLLCFFLFFLTVQSFVVSPSNSTIHPSDQYTLQASSLNGILLFPLTSSLTGLSDSEEKSFQISGNLTEVKAEISVSSTSIACIPCDASAYLEPLTASNTLSYIINSNRASAVILYTTTSTHCNLTNDNQTEAYQNIFSVIGERSASVLQNHLNSTPSASLISMSATASGMDSVPTSAGTKTQSGGGPNTAMIILYSITGVITALFLGIIITGAVRAHRHPERYGPRIIRAGRRARQSRARGIARAMLETIPIVKFDDDSAAAKRDIELNAEGDAHIAEGDTQDTHAEAGSEPKRERERESEEPEPETETPTPIADAPSTESSTKEEGNFVCPICTDDFIKGQDLRVLPCNHQFHPECIDPWLVNVSGTCPLCRIDLNPKEETAEENTEPGEAEVPHRQSHRVSNLINGRGHLDLRRMYDSTVEERLSALRYLRATRHDGEEPSNRLSTRFRDRFRIRTRAHGSADSDSPTTQPHDS